MTDYTPYQQKIIKRYYNNQDTIQRQRLAELVGELYLAEGKKRERAWQAAAAGQGQQPLPARENVTIVDGAGRPIEALEVGSTLFVKAQGLEPNRNYEFHLDLDQKTISLARMGSDARGEIRPLALWYESGI